MLEQLNKRIESIQGQYPWIANGCQEVDSLAMPPQGLHMLFGVAWRVTYTALRGLIAGNGASNQ